MMGGDESFAAAKARCVAQSQRGGSGAVLAVPTVAGPPAPRCILLFVVQIRHDT